MPVPYAPMPISSSLSRKLATMSFYATLMVVWMHTVFSIPDGIDPHYRWLLELTKAGVCKVAVPWFFLCSGFLFAGHVHEKGWWLTALRKRVRSLLVPYMVWCVGMWMLFDLLARCGVTHGEIRAYSLSTLLSVLGITSMTPAWDICWYIRMLMILVVVSPVLIYGIMRVGRLFIGGLFGLLFAQLLIAPCFPNGFFYFVVPLGWLFWFGLGIYLRVVDESQRMPKRRGSFLISIVGVSLFAARYYLESVGISGGGGIEIFAIIVTLLGLWGMVSQPLPGWMTSAAFPTYLLHGLFQTLLRPFDCIDLNTLMGFVISFVVVTIACFVSTKVLYRIVPRFAAIIFGGRG